MEEAQVMLLDEETSTKFGSIGHTICTERPERGFRGIEDAKPLMMADEWEGRERVVKPKEG
jgi:hypothetical protein